MFFSRFCILLFNQQFQLLSLSISGLKVKRVKNLLFCLNLRVFESS